MWIYFTVKLRPLCPVIHSLRGGAHYAILDTVMTLIQITALLSLLFAFGVDQSTINKVEAILTAPQSVTMRAMPEEPKEEEVVAPEAPKKSKYAQENVPISKESTNSHNR